MSGDVVPVDGRVGGGGAPGRAAARLGRGAPRGVRRLLRRGEPGVVARVERGRCLVDLRCVPPDRDGEVEQAVRAALAARLAGRAAS